MPNFSFYYFFPFFTTFISKDQHSSFKYNKRHGWKGSYFQAHTFLFITDASFHNFTSSDRFLEFTSDAPLPVVMLNVMRFPDFSILVVTQKIKLEWRQYLTTALRISI